MRHSAQTLLNCKRDFANEILNYCHFLHSKPLNVICSPSVKFLQRQTLISVTSVHYPPAESLIKHYHTIQQCSTWISLVLHIKYLYTPTQRLNSSIESPCLDNEIKSCNIHKLIKTAKYCHSILFFQGEIYKLVQPHLPSSSFRTCAGRHSSALNTQHPSPIFFLFFPSSNFPLQTRRHFGVVATPTGKPGDKATSRGQAFRRLYW